MALTKAQLLDAIRKVDSNLSLAAADLGISRPTLYRWMRVHEISRTWVLVGPETPDVIRLPQSDQDRARSRVTSAIKNRSLLRQPCVVCGELEVEAHHHKGYGPGHELDVQWLCLAHHRAVHRKHDPLIVA